jgi:hypothetical protein
MCRLAWRHTGGKGLTLSIPALKGFRLHKSIKIDQDGNENMVKGYGFLSQISGLM